MELTNRYFETLTTEKLSTFMNKQLSVKTSYFLAVLFEKLQEKSNLYFSQKKRLIEKYAEVDKDKNMIEDSNGVKFTDPDSFHKEFDELMRITVDIGLEKIDFSEESANFTVEEMMLMIPFIKEIKYG